MNRIELSENDTEGRYVELPPTVAAELAERGLVDVIPLGEGRWRLIPLPNTVGAVRVGAIDVLVRPKAQFASLLFMLGYARDPGLSPSEISGTTDSDLWAMVGETLARLATGALLRGVLQGYVTEDASLTVVRGRVRVADQMARRPGLSLPLEVRFDDYAVDIPENQILRSAVQRMSLVPRLPHGLRRRLAHLSARLEGATVLSAGAPLPVWRASGLNARYHAALRLAALVLRTTGLGTSAGGEPLAAFVVNMATAFEDFVTVALHEAFTHVGNGRTARQYPVFLDGEARIQVEPDVVHLVANTPKAVLDAKYKLASRAGGYPVPDLYQMLAYCTVLGLDRGYLVYAGSRAEGANPRVHRIARTTVDVITWPLDVALRPVDLLDQVADLAETALREAAPAGSPARMS